MKEDLTDRSSRADEGGVEYLLTHVIQDFMHFLRQTGLSGPQIHALLHIYHAGECQVSEIGALSGSSAAAASQMVDRLVQQGLVERTEDPTNRRVRKLRLSGKGLRLLRRGMGLNRPLADLMAALNPEQRKAVRAAFGYLAQAGRHIHAHAQGRIKQNV